MPQYRYRAMTTAGEIVEGELDAASNEEVCRRAEYLGHMLIDAVSEEKAGLLGRRSGSIRKKLPASRDVTTLLRQLALLIGAGLTLDAALLTLTEDTNKSLSWFANNLRAGISAGDGFAEALERHRTILEPAYIAMVKAGEASGRIEVVLDAVVADRARQELLRERVNSALRYPIFLIASATLILFFFLIFIVPQFEPVFRDLGSRLNGGTAFVLFISNWLRNNFQLFFGAFLALVAGIWGLLRQRGLRGRAMEMIALIPGVSGPMRDRRAARIVGTLGLMLENGVSLPTTLKILRDVVSEPQHVASIDHIHEQVRSGRRFAEALAQTDLLPPLAVRMLKVGDEAGDLPSVAKHAAQFYEHRLGVGLDRLMGVIGPASIIAVSLIVGGLILSIMSALLSITELAT
jgi:general secretion pathway protein F